MAAPQEQGKPTPQIEFSKRSALVILAAQREAQSLRHDYLDDNT